MLILCSSQFTPEIKLETDNLELCISQRVYSPVAHVGPKGTGSQVIFRDADKGTMVKSNSLGGNGKECILRALIIQTKFLDEVMFC